MSFSKNVWDVTIYVNRLIEILNRDDVNGPWTIKSYRLNVSVFNSTFGRMNSNYVAYNIVNIN